MQASESPLREPPNPKTPTRAGVKRSTAHVSPDRPIEFPKRKKKHGETTKCICGNSKCDEIMKKLKSLDPSRHAYFNVPAPLKPLKQKLVRKPKPKQRLNRKIKEKRHKRFLECLGAEAKRRGNIPIMSRPTVNDGEVYSEKTQLKFASLHVHPEI